MYTIMKTSIIIKMVLLLHVSITYCAAQTGVSTQKNISDFTAINAETKTQIYKGEAAIFGKQKDPDEGSSLLIINDMALSTGIIEFDLAGNRSEDAGPMSRGFLGLAFRIDENNSSYDCFYLRALNGRAENQLQRNHTVQYIAMPYFEWFKLRKETPGKYETYVDIAPNEWVHVKVVIDENRAEIYVNNATHPTLIVNELLSKEKNGKLALWVGPGTDAYFANLKITKTK